VFSRVSICMGRADYNRLKPRNPGGFCPLQPLRRLHREYPLHKDSPARRVAADTIGRPSHRAAPNETRQPPTASRTGPKPAAAGPPKSLPRYSRYF
jgi:hypothetical protein